LAKNPPQANPKALFSIFAAVDINWAIVFFVRLALSR
jgi:hypothetical protein